MQNNWSQILQVLEHCLEPNIFNIWVTPLDVQLTESTLKIKAKNTFVANWVQSKLASIITDAASSVLGFVPTLEIEVVSATANSGSASASSNYSANSFGVVNSATQLATSNFTVAAPELNVPLPLPLPLPLVAQPHSCSSVAQPLAVPLTGLQAGSQTLNSASLLSTNNTTAPSEQLIEQLSIPVHYQGIDRSASRCTNNNWRYTFDDFIVGASNELAYAASRNVCSSNKLMDVLFLSSAPGLGKTHLLQAAGHGLSLAANRKDLRTAYLTAEEFCSQLFAAIKNKATDSFKARFRDLDLFLLEDVHFLQGKEKMQDELLGTLKSLTEKGGRVVLSSSFEPRELHDMDSQLISRLSSGLIAKIDRPDHQTRVRIIQEKSRLHQVVLPENVTELLASHIRNDVRQIESCLQNLILKAKVLNVQVSLGMAIETLKNYSIMDASLSFQDIVEQICKGFGLTVEQLNSRSRKREYVTARNAAYYLSRKHTDMSLQQIGERFNRKHSSVLKGISSLEEEISKESAVGRQLQRTIGLIERNGGLQL